MSSLRCVATPLAVPLLVSDSTPSPLVLHLQDGTPVLLRTFVPGDRESIIEAFRRLSVDSRYYRFWSGQEQIPDSLLNRFLNPVPGEHETWAALDPERPDEPGYGGASYWRSTKFPHRAEISFTVADEMQRRGLGTLLLALLWLRARASGVTQFTGVVLPDNYTVLNWFRALGSQMAYERGQYSFDLMLDEELLKDTTAAASLKSRIEEIRQTWSALR